MAPDRRVALFLHAISQPPWPVRTGLKFALAGILSLLVALWLRLPEPTWAVTTAFVLSTPRFVGAIAEKTILRILGAILGAVTGFVITGSFEQNPILFLLAVGLMVAATTAAYGGKFIPYGFRQWSYTATLVAAQGMANPEASWSIGLARCTEICVGIVVTTTLSFVLWPRYAHAEFLQKIRHLLAETAQDFRQRAGRFLEGKTVPSHRSVGASLAALREMVRLGAMESPGFRRSLPMVHDLIAAGGDLLNAVESLEEELSAKSAFRPYVERPLRELYESVDSVLTLLGHPNLTAESLAEPTTKMWAALGAYEQALRDFRRDGLKPLLSTAESLEHARHWGAMHEIVDASERIAKILPKLAEVRPEAFPGLRFERPALPPREWIIAGLRGGLAVAAALFLTNWFHPPGGDLLVVGVYLLTAFSVETCRREGDIRAYRVLPGLTLFLLGWFLFLLLATPFLANDLAMNLLLGLMLFGVGYGSDSKIISPYQTLLALLLIVGVVGLNAQQPVGFQELVDPVMGLWLAAILSAVIRRSLWPNLPQTELKNLWLALRSFLLSIFQPPAPSARARAEFALDLVRAEEINQLLRTGPTGEEMSTSWQAWWQLIRRLEAQLLPLARPLPLLPAEVTNFLLAAQADLRQRVAALSWAGTSTGFFEQPIEDGRELINQARLEPTLSLAALVRLARIEKARRLLGELQDLAPQLHPERTLADSIL